ncbi:unnamed protein product [Effrenium voratum]|uniref:Uncharacterized protein n=1 Tax=Effrenium voratum TaxID=2562239 RepID=A0AA36N6K3_9DINO|nr:unnamed protein product [Effrenium voratum]CAJ1436319.1 unnamed protein product [Effrenium voratum]
MDVAAQCRIAARKFTQTDCAESSTEAMGLGLEALNAALACAEVTETTAAELQSKEGTDEGDRFVGAAVRASLAAATASNAAMSAAIAAVEGNRQVIQAAHAKTEPAEAEEEEAQEAKSEKSESDRSEQPEETRRVSEDLGVRRQITQRNNNHKVLQRLNAEILTHQKNVRQFLQANRQLIPEVTCEAKGKAHMLLQDYACEVRLELQQLPVEELLPALKSCGLLAPLFQKQVLAIPVCPKTRVLKMTALYDLQTTLQVLELEVFQPVRQKLGKADHAPLDEIVQHVDKELRSYTGED